MKKVLLCILAFVLVAGLILIVGPKEQAIAETITLRFGHHLPPMHHQNKEVTVVWAKEVAKRTGGRVDIKIYPSQQLCKIPEAYDTLVSGGADIAMITPSYCKGRFPLDEIFHLPYFIPGDNTDPLGSKIRTVLYEKYINPIHFKDVKCLWTGRYSQHVIFSPKNPVRKMEDMKGKVIGIPGGRNLSRLIQVLGGSPEFSGTPSMYTNLERGVIDGQSIPIDTMLPFKLYEVAKYITRYKAAGSTYVISMNMQKWNSLPPDIQKTIEGMRTWIEDIQADVWGRSNERNVMMAKKKGIELIDFSPEEMARWVAVSKPLDMKWVEEMDAKGFPASEMYKLAQEMMSK